MIPDRDLNFNEKLEMRSTFYAIRVSYWLWDRTDGSTGDFSRHLATMFNILSGNHVFSPQVGGQIKKKTKGLIGAQSSQWTSSGFTRAQNLSEQKWAAKLSTGDQIAQKVSLKILSSKYFEVLWCEISGSWFMKKPPR